MSISTARAPASSIRFGTAGSKRATPSGRRLWRTVSDALSAPEIQAALRERLQKGLEMRAKGSGESWPVPMYPQPVLYADFDGYAIKPHPDTRRKVLTMLIYMPEDESQRGTRHDRLQDLADGRLRLEVLWPGQGQRRRPSCPTPALPSSSSIRRTASCTRAGTAATRSRSTIAKPRMTILNTYYAKPPKAGEEENEYR